MGRLSLMRLKLKVQILLATFILVVVPVAVVGIWVNHHVDVNLRRQAQEDIEQESKNVSLILEHLLLMDKQSLLVAAAQDDWGDPNARQVFLSNLKYSSVGWSNVRYWDSQTGKLLASVPPVSGEVPSVKGKSWFMQSLAQQGVSLGNMAETATWTRKGFIFYVAVSDEKRNTVGVLSALLLPEDMRQELERMLSLPSNMEIWLVSPDNQFVLDPHTYPGEPESYNSTFLEQLQRTNLVSERSLPISGWKLVVARDESTALADARKLSRGIGVITVGILALALILALGFGRSLLGPLTRLMGNIRTISQGYSIADLPALPKRHDELGELAEAFRAMADKTEEYSRDVILALVAALETRDSYTKSHSERVALYAQMLARRLEVEPVMRENILRAGLLHDVGKIGVPEGILNKPGALSAEEWAIMRSHPRQSYEILKEVPFYLETGIAEVALQHHERWDGRGYPQALAGEQIRLEARILAVADAFDAMTSHRVYRKELSLEKAIEELERGAGQQFAPDCVQAFLSIPTEELKLGLNISLNDYIRSLHRGGQRVS